jgi:preprotein translocase subunit SecE
MINPLKFIQSVKQEAFKVTWPTRKDVLVGSLMVFVLATIAAIFFLLLDQIYKFFLDLILTINF